MTIADWLEYVLSSDLLGFVRDDAKNVVNSMCDEHPGLAQLLTERARTDMQEAYCSRMGILYVHVTSEAVAKEAWHEDPIGARSLEVASRDALRRATDNVFHNMNADPNSYFHETLPLLLEHEKRIRSNFIESQIEMLERVLRYRHEISERFYGGVPITRIESFTGMGGDVHRRGRAVAGIQTNAGTFYYKPHDCQIDKMYHQMVEQWFSDFTVAADCVAGDGCGFVSQLVNEPLANEDELHDYYANFGRFAALFSGIGGMDMHCENVLPIGARPAAIDLETMLSATQKRTPRIGDVTGTSRRGTLLPHSYMLGSGILPAYTPPIGVSSPLYESTVQTHEYLPKVNGVLHSIEGFEDDFLRGFKEGYVRMMDCREELKTLFSVYKDGVVRIVLRNTTYYQYVLTQLYRKKSLASPEGRDATLRMLRAPYEAGGHVADETIVQYEASCLLEGDLPYYCTTLDGTALCGGSLDEVLHLNYLGHSAKERASRILDELSEPNERYETDVIRNAFIQVALSVPEEGLARLPEQQPEPGQILSVVSGLNEDVERSTIRLANGEVVWRSYAAYMRGERSCGALGDVADVGRYLAEVVRSGVLLMERKKLMSLLGGCVDFIQRWVSMSEGDETYVRDTCPLVPAQGLDGILRGCHAMARADVPHAKEIYRDLLGILARNHLLVVDNPKQLEGMAWLVLVLCDCKVLDERLVPLIREGAQSLVRLWDPSFRQAPSQCAAVGAALASALGVLGCDDLATPATAAFGQVCSAYVKRIAGWPDEGESIRWLAPRGTTAAWIGICALTARRYVTGGDLRRRVDEVLDLALGSLMGEDTLWHGDQRLYGNAMAVEFLLGAARELDDEGYRLRAGQILAGMLLRKERVGAFCTSPQGLRKYFDVSYMRGSLGVGACALEWYRTENQPRT